MLNSSDVKGIASSDGKILSLEELTKIVNQINIESGTGTASVQQKYVVNNNTYSANASGVNATAFGGKRYDKLTDGNRMPTSAEGNQSFAAGGCAHAYGDWAVSIGKDTKSYQKSSYSFGGGTQAGMTEDEFNAYFWDSSTNTPLHNGRGKDSSGNILSNEGETYAESYSFGVAFGNTCKAFGKNSLAHGFFTQASGMNSIALNKDSRANGDSSVAIGAGCIADGENSFAAGLNSKATGYNSFAAGASNNANGLRSVVFGQESRANGGNSFISGYQCNTERLANDAACFGTNATAKGRADFITGWYNRAAEYTETSDNTPSRTPQLICGRFNTPNTNAIFQVGNGEWNTSSIHTYSNAFEVLADGRAKVYGKPTDNNDVVRLGDLGGAIGGGGSVFYTFNGQLTDQSLIISTGESVPIDVSPANEWINLPQGHKYLVLYYVHYKQSYPSTQNWMGFVVRDGDGIPYGDLYYYKMAYFPSEWTTSTDNNARQMLTFMTTFGLIDATSGIKGVAPYLATDYTTGNSNDAQVVILQF